MLVGRANDSEGRNRADILCSTFPALWFHVTRCSQLLALIWRKALLFAFPAGPFISDIEVGRQQAPSVIGALECFQGSKLRVRRHETK